MEEKLHLIEQAVSLIDGMTEVGKEFLGDVENGCESTFQLHFNDLLAGITSLKQCYPSIKDSLHHAYYEEMLENVLFTLDQLADLLNNQDDGRAVTLLKYQLIPFLQEFREEVYFWGLVYPDEDKMKHFYEKDFAASTKNMPHNSPYKYKISIFIPVYNNLEYTKQCLKSIKDTVDFNKFNCEFILINDGSTDETQEYFESLGIEKVIYFKKNVKTMIFTMAFRICEGEYFLFINNDTLVAKGWLENLLACIESAPDIISATPSTPNTSNYQSFAADAYSLKAAKDIVKIRNRSDSSKWKERSRILPVIALYRSCLVEKIGLSDRLFYTMEFWDDDFSLRARKNGYRQMLCEDTYCYHYGSATGKAGQKKENTLENGRHLFQFKNQIDAWEKDNDFCFNLQVILNFKFSPLYKNDVHILGIDCGFGDTLLQMKKLLHNRGRNTTLYQTTANVNFNKYQAVSSQFFLPYNSIEQIADLFPDVTFDYIFVSPKLENYTAYSLLLEILQKRLSTGGILYFQTANIFYQPLLDELLHFTFPCEDDCRLFINTQNLWKILAAKFNKVDCFTSPVMLPGTSEFQTLHCQLQSRKDDMSALLSSETLVFQCVK